MKACDEVLLAMPGWGCIEVVGVGGEALGCIGHGDVGHMRSLFNSNRC